jgi:deoxyribonuclease-4
MTGIDNRLIGAHMSITGEISKGIDRGVSLGCTAIQIFTGYNNRWISKSIASEDLKHFNEKKHQLKIIFAHNNYLINLASFDPVKSKKSFSSMLEELHRAEQLQLPFLVMHPGSHLGAGEKDGLKRIARQLNVLISETKDFKVRILLETTAGQGTNLGHCFEHFTEIMNRIRDPERIGICFDTCHSFTAGYDLRIPSEYEKTFDSFDRIVGLSHIFAFHLNDSKFGLGSRKDRHEHIGQGCIGLNAFRLLLNDERFNRIPMVLETPKGKEMEEDRMNLAVLKSLIISEDVMNHRIHDIPMME